MPQALENCERKLNTSLQFVHLTFLSSSYSEIVNRLLNSVSFLGRKYIGVIVGGLASFRLEELRGV